MDKWINGAEVGVGANHMGNKKYFDMGRQINYA